ncbi:MAG: A24 family peptidase C-terminal domain-containing protein [Candidatus Bathyarchaeota archaeon]|nr:A24 family peptidase C-terminal domain-containing protein [Candidatus Bathyarchaeota archaeon]
MVFPLQTVTALARTTITLSFLFYASWSDYKTREVGNRLWILFAPPAFTLTFLELYLYESSQLVSYGICFSLTAVLAIILFYAGGFGGADAKALMCLALALPFYPNNLLTPFLNEISLIAQNFFPITVFSNSILIAAATALYMLLYNAFWHKKTRKKLFEEHKKESFGRKLLVLMTGYKVSISKMKEKWHLYPLEDLENVEDGFKRKLVLIPKDEERNTIVERLAKAVETRKIQDMVWATPGLPMLIFITAGLIIALFFGDIVWIFVRFLLG